MLITRLWIGLELVFVLVAAHASTPADQGQERSAGSPLLMSRSIDLPPAQATWCKSSGLDASQRDGCVTAMRVLRLMSDEPRDKKWADAMEAYLQSAVNSLDSTRVTSRNIQCRLSWCVVEVGATGGPTAVSALLLNAVQARSIKLFERTILFAPDIGPSESEVTDVLRIYKRYCRATNELLDSSGHAVANFDAQGKDC